MTIGQLGTIVGLCPGNTSYVTCQWWGEGCHRILLSHVGKKLKCFIKKISNRWSFFKTLYKTAALFWQSNGDMIVLPGRPFQYDTGNNCINTLRPRRNEQHFADNIFKRIFFNENVWISIKISLKYVPMGPINNIPALVQIMAWRRSGDKPLSGPIMVRLPTHICVTRPQWVNRYQDSHYKNKTTMRLSYLYNGNSCKMRYLYLKTAPKMWTQDREDCHMSIFEQISLKDNVASS